ncbi:2-isopropylmalate synthase [Helicobacter muridarum]|uniref:2-isopropylmalate synthase n=1 Tax=Helicobacter muridarum TaxID=216 RepID=A0A099TXP0_9HELI|nr:2-isopropylmalate synthase [Helicobacter muridarum]TLE00244.1 2-isopropylmalate synthase [Helicobacter muridarum]STQ85736.1 2-isopropylmalate synthase [Helicobacter muridarum]
MNNCKQNIITIFDTTLRDGEQSPGASMNIEEKIAIALQLEKLGVDVIEAGFAASSTGDFESISQIAKNLQTSAVCSLSRCVESDILRAKDSLKYAKKPRIHLFLATSPIHMEYKLKKKPSEVLDLAIKSISMAREFCDDVQFSCEDACRSEMSFLKEISLAAIEAGAKTLNMPDTVGYRLPHEIGEIIEQLYSVVQDRAVLSVHCHNDLGQAVSNSIYGAMKGARQIECTINGLGERAGNCALEEVVMILKTRKDIFKQYGELDTNINTKEIYKTSKLVAEITGIRPQPNKAIVGKNAFSHESGIHQDGILKHRETYEIMKPSDIGINDNENLVLGKHSGRAAFKDKIIQLGFNLTDDELQIAFDKFKSICDQKKIVYDEDIAAIIDEQFSRIPQVYILESFQCSTASNGAHLAALCVRKDSEIRNDCALGNGAVDSILRAIERVCEVSGRLLDYKVEAITSGKDAIASVMVKVIFEGTNNPVIGHGKDLDTLYATAKAYIQALNSFERMKNLLQDKRDLRYGGV